MSVSVTSIETFSNIEQIVPSTEKCLLLHFTLFCLKLLLLWTCCSKEHSSLFKFQVLKVSQFLRSLFQTSQIIRTVWTRFLTLNLPARNLPTHTHTTHNFHRLRSMIFESFPKLKSERPSRQRDQCGSSRASSNALMKPHGLSKVSGESYGAGRSSLARASSQPTANP